jgi:hypothetical protein
MGDRRTTSSRIHPAAGSNGGVVKLVRAIRRQGVVFVRVIVKDRRSWGGLHTNIGGRQRAA